MRSFTDPLAFQAEIMGTKTRSGAIARQFLEFLTANPNRALSAEEMCAAIGVAERTLRDACEKHLGMGPIRYLTVHRMHEVHRALISADASNTTVTRVAMEHGFAELGRFSVAYRSLFRESPSETLRRQSNQVGTISYR